MITEGVTEVVVGADETRKQDLADAVNIANYILRNCPPPPKNTNKNKILFTKVTLIIIRDNNN